MRDAEMGDVMVIEHNQVCGMVTDRAIVGRTVVEAQDPATTTLADICRHVVVTVTPTESVEEAVRLMRTHAMRRGKERQVNRILVGYLRREGAGEQHVGFRRLLQGDHAGDGQLVQRDGARLVHAEHVHRPRHPPRR